MKREIRANRYRVIRQVAVFAVPVALSQPRRMPRGWVQLVGVSNALQGKNRTAGSTSTMERPTVAPPKLNVQHIFHITCQRNNGIQIAYCGHKGKIYGESWYPENASSKDCSMCIMARAMYGCPICGYKPEK